MRLKTFLNIVIFVLVFPLIVFSIISFYVTKSEMMSRLNHLARQNLTIITRQLDANLNASLSNIEVLSYLPLFQDYQFNEVPVDLIRQELNAFFNRYQDLYERLILIDEKGNPIFLVDKFFMLNGQKTVFVKTTAFTSYDTLYWNQCQKSREKMFFSTPFLSESGLAIRAGTLLAGKQVLFLDIRISKLCGVVFEKYKYFTRSKPFILDRKGRILFSNNPIYLNDALAISHPAFNGFSEELLQALPNFDAHWEYEKQYRICVSNYYAPLDWQVGYIANLQEFFAPITRAGYYNLGLGGLLLVILLSVSGWLSRSYTRSMQTLVDGAHTIVSGNFDHKINLGNFFELQKLASDFNKIGKRLQKYINGMKKMHMELLEKKKVEEVSELKSQFISHVSHEMMTPLTAVKWSVDNLLAGVGGKVNPKQKEYLLGLKDVSDHLSRIFSDMLDLSRIEAGKMELIKSDFDLQEAVNEAIYLNQKPLNEKKLRVNFSAGDSFPYFGDRTRITQIIRNIFENAIKYSPEGSSIEIDLQTVNHPQQGRTYRLIIRDHGPGIGPEMLPHIFDRFYKGSKKKKGIGLGLAIAQNLARLHGGYITATSREGKGATFTVHLPVNP